MKRKIWVSLSISIDCIYDPDRAAREHLAGPWGVVVYPTNDPDSSWRFSLIGFPDQAEAVKAANTEVARRRNAGILPGTG